MISCVLHWPDRGGFLRRTAAALAVLSLSFSVSSCGQEEVPLLKEKSRDCIYRITDVPLSEEEGEDGGGSEFVALLHLQDRVCAVVNTSGMMGTIPTLISCDEQGEDILRVELEVPSGEGGDYNMQYCCEDGNGGFYAWLQCNSWNEETGEQSVERTIARYDETGTLAEEWPVEPDPSVFGDDYYLETMCHAGNGMLVFRDDSGISAFDPTSGEFSSLYRSSERYFDGGVVCLRDGSIVLSIYDDKSHGYLFHTLDPETGTFSDRETPAPSGANTRNLRAGAVHDLLYDTENSIYTYDFKSGKSRKLFDFIASDLVVNDLGGVVELSGEKLAIITMEWGDAGQELYLKICDHIPPEQVKDKEELVISCVYLDSRVMKMVVDFNRRSEDYRIRIADYSKYSSDNDWNYPYTKLNTDIISGYIPDILMIDQEMPVESYISKGILDDLTPFLASDEELSDVTFLENVMDAYRIDGKLYELIPSFMVYTGVAKSSLLGDRKSLSMEDLQEICDTRGIPMRESFGSQTRNSLFSFLLYVQGSEYVDLETGKCNFDSPEFIRLLELAKQCPEKSNDNDYQEMQKAWREDRSVVMLYGFGDFRSYAQVRYGSFGEEVRMIGIPGGSGSGSVIMPQNRIAITTSTKHPEAAWEFVRSFLLQDYQDEISWSFPLRRDSLDKQAAKAMERPYYIDDTGQRVEYDDTWWLNGQEIIIPPMSEEETEKMIDFLSGCDRRVYMNSTVTDIINEEAAAFFENQKSAEDVARVIQSRVQIYVHENR